MEPNWSELVHRQPSGPSDEGPLGTKVPGLGTQAGAFAEQNYRVPTCPFPGQGREEWATGGGPLPLLRPDSRTAEGSQGSRWVFSSERTPPFRVCQGAHNPGTGQTASEKWLWLKYGRLDCQKQVIPERLLTRLSSTWFL